MTPEQGNSVSSPEIRTHEVLAVPEAEYRLTQAVAVVFYHAPGVGGSTLTRSFAEVLGVDIGGENYFDGGKMLRDVTGNTEAQTEYMPRSKKTDRDIDRAQMDLFTIATTDKPVIINAKLGGYNAWKFMREHPQTKIIPILVTCDARKAAGRMRQRKDEEISRKFEKISEDASAGLITNDQYSDLLELLYEESEENISKNVRDETRKRIAEDMLQFSSVYPELNGITNLYLPEPTVIVGKEIDPKTGHEIDIREKLYRFQVSTTHKSPNQALKTLVGLLLEAGEIEKIERRNSANSVANGRTNEPKK